MGRVHFRKDFWDCFQGLGKNCPIADRHDLSNDPRINCGTHFGFSSFLKWRITGAKLRKPVVSIPPQALTLYKNFDHFKYSLRVNKKTFGVNIRLCLSQVRTIIYTSTGQSCIKKTCIETTDDHSWANERSPAYLTVEWCVCRQRWVQSAAWVKSVDIVELQEYLQSHSPA